MGLGNRNSDNVATKFRRNLPLFLAAAMIVGVGIATYADAGMPPKFADGGQVQTAKPPATTPPGKQDNPPATSPAKPAEPAPKKVDLVYTVTFPDDRGTTYILGREIATRLGAAIELSADEKTLTIDDKAITSFRRTYNGDVLVPLRDIALFQGTLNEDPATHQVTVSIPKGQFTVEVGKKRIEVDKALQQLTAFQGDVVVVKTNISTGRPGHNTPNGTFSTGSKERMHYSHKYNDAPMPYAIEVYGDVFLHGYTSVPPYPASHGCVRIPLNHDNPAHYLFKWVERGTETKIFGSYNWESHSTRHRKKRKSNKKASAAKAAPTPVAKPPAGAGN